MSKRRSRVNHCPSRTDWSGVPQCQFGETVSTAQRISIVLKYTVVENVPISRLEQSSTSGGTLAVVEGIYAFLIIGLFVGSGKNSGVEDKPTGSGEAPSDLHTPGVIKHLSEAISKVHQAPPQASLSSPKRSIFRIHSNLTKLPCFYATSPERLSAKFQQIRRQNVVIKNLGVAVLSGHPKENYE